ncbi:uncharacterized protein LOC131326319 [Rhododendron vialii]|uniref:uncharacterized protein LOC131326319 n=1 Tax=Rhododendron vialii TaxID=182163 RepID=UPI00265E7346|nr:uncharacterized protein LOC131326319 [Rhododendron vialii]XP_058215044.1 uncharacterized protein LOC131326319 [Rhododendron vialii]
MDETLVPSDPQPTDEVMNEVQQNPNKNPSKSDSESESDDNDSDDEAQQTVQIETLEIELSNNPANYDAHVQYIRALRKKGDIEKLRKAREAMSELFPLSPAMWQDWAKDEASLGSGSESFPEIEKLYECGVFDYLSVSLWCDYLNFVQEHEPSVRECSPVGILKARDLFERALTAAGLHVAEGHRIWEAYREFEQAIFYTIDATDVEAREKQIQRIRHIFHRQMSIPLGELRSTLVAYKSWEAEHGTVPDANSGELDGVSSYVASAYQKALEMLNARVLFEERVSRLDAPDVERLQEYMAYLKFEQSSGDPARVQLLYERAITEFPISNALWFDYTRYMDSTLKASSIVRDVYLRATKNCPWVGELWVRYLLSLERGRASEKEISAVFEKSILCTFSSFDEYLDIFLTRVDGLRRKISQAGEVEDALDYAVIRDTFQRASDYLSPHLKDMDGLLRIHSYWARLESSLGKDLVAARGVWECLLKISGSMLDAWKGYIAMEAEMGNINEARSLYRRCYSKRFPGTGSEDICHSWLRFEREFGMLEDFDRAIQKLTPRLEELQLFRLQQESKNVGLMTNQRENISKRNTPEKRKQGSNVGDEQPKAKRQKNTAPDMRKAKGEDKAREKSSVETKTLENTQVKDGKSSSAHGKETKDLTPEKPKYKDQCTAFVSNLGFQATYDDLRGFFSDVGGVVAIRILKDKYSGKSRGLAYVDFANDAHLEAAVAKNKRTLLGKRLSIARSDPKQRKTRESLGRHAPVEHGEMSKHANGQTSTVGESDPKEDKSDTSKGATGGHDPKSTNPHNDGDNIQLKGKNTFAVPRTVRPLGWTDKNIVKMEVAEEGEDEKPKSNDEFRKMLLRK